MRNMKTKFLTMALISCTLIAGGCAASLSPAPAFEDVAINVKQRTGKAISWDAGGKDDLRARAHVDRLLKRQLSAASAIQVALLNNKSLQATYAGLGVAQADLVQAGLLSNPILDVSALWPYQPQTAAANVTAGVVVNFIELFWKRYKQAVAESVLAEAKIRVSGMVIDHASTTNLAFIDYVASKQEIGLLKQVVNAARATVASAKAIREAGNSTPLDFELQQNVLTQAKLELASVEARLAGEREKLNVLMGTSGKQTRWHAPSRLPSTKSLNFGKRHAESFAVERSLELAALRQKILTLGYKYQLTDKKALIPDIGLGAEYENKGSSEGREQEIGPKLDVTLPLFDQGQAKRARAIMEIRQAQDEYWAMGVRVRSAARLAQATLETARTSADYYTGAMLPQQARLLQATQQQYNAMQADVFRVIRARRDQIQTSRSYIGALKTYWRARVNFQQILSGRLPVGAGEVMVTAAAPGAGGEAGGH